MTTTRATTVRTDSGFCVLGPKPMHRSPPVWVILDGIDPSGRSAVHIPRGRAPRQKISIRDGVAAMAMAAAVLAARVAALGEGLGLIERDNSPSIRAARNGLERVHAAFFHREMASRWKNPCLESPRCSGGMV